MTVKEYAKKGLIHSNVPRFCGAKDIQILICEDALGEPFWQKRFPYDPSQKLLKNGFCTDGMHVQILIYRGVTFCMETTLPPLSRVPHRTRCVLLKEFANEFFRLHLTREGYQSRYLQQRTVIETVFEVKQIIPSVDKAKVVMSLPARPLVGV